MTMPMTFQPLYKISHLKSGIKFRFKLENTNSSSKNCLHFMKECAILLNRCSNLISHLWLQHLKKLMRTTHLKRKIVPFQFKVDFARFYTPRITFRETIIKSLNCKLNIQYWTFDGSLGLFLRISFSKILDNRIMPLVNYTVNKYR